MTIEIAPLADRYVRDRHSPLVCDRGSKPKKASKKRKKNNHKYSKKMLREIRRGTRHLDDDLSDLCKQVSRVETAIANFTADAKRRDTVRSINRKLDWLADDRQNR